MKQVLLTVAIREGEHAHAFTKRLCELGFGVQDRPDPKHARNMEIANADCSDLEKFEAFGYGRDGEMSRDPFKGIFDDESIDIQTGELLGRYVAEERDSGRRLRACYAALRERAGHRAEEGRAKATMGSSRELRELFGIGDLVVGNPGELGKGAEEGPRRALEGW